METTKLFILKERKGTTVERTRDGKEILKKRKKRSCYSQTNSTSYVSDHREKQKMVYEMLVCVYILVYIYTNTSIKR
jgi:hypothetical protein